MSFLTDLFAHNQTPPTDDQSDPTNKFQDLLSGLSGVGSVLGAQAKGDAQGQVSQGQLDNSNNSNLINLYNSAQNAQFQAGNQDLQRQQYATNNRATTAKQALIGALLGGGYQPSHIGPVNPNSGGGLARSILGSPSAMAAMQTLNKQANTAQNTPLTFTGGNILAQPTLAPPTKISTGAAGKTGGFLQLLGAAAPLLGLL